MMIFELPLPTSIEAPINGEVPVSFEISPKVTVRYIDEREGFVDFEHDFLTMHDLIAFAACVEISLDHPHNPIAVKVSNSTKTPVLEYIPRTPHNPHMEQVWVERIEGRYIEGRVFVEWVTRLVDTVTKRENLAANPYIYNTLA